MKKVLLFNFLYWKGPVGDVYFLDRECVKFLQCTALKKSAEIFNALLEFISRTGLFGRGSRNRL